MYNTANATCYTFDGLSALLVSELCITGVRTFCDT